MAKKAKNIPVSTIEVQKYIPKPSVKDGAEKYLIQKGYYVFLESGTLLGLFSTEAEYNACKKELIEKYGHGGKTPFSFGGRIGDVERLKAERKTARKETNASSKKETDEEPYAAEESEEFHEEGE